MELYNTLPFNNPSRQAFYTVSQNQQVFVEVRFAHLASYFIMLSYATCVFVPKFKLCVLCGIHKVNLYSVQLQLRS